VNAWPTRNHNHNIVRVVRNPYMFRITDNFKPAGAAFKNPSLRPFRKA
jgi:hypothetical protein